MDREKVIAGLTMLADTKNDDTCEGLKCCKIAEDALELLKEQQKLIDALEGQKYNLTKALNYWMEKDREQQEQIDDLKQTANGQPVKPKINKAGQVCCGKCGIPLATMSISVFGGSRSVPMRSRYCCYCGTEVDWNEG